jgi:O-antigen biosynthesis protein
MGDPENSKVDLKKALDLEPGNSEANGLALEWLDGVERERAALRIVASSGSRASDLRAALLLALTSRDRVVHRLRAADGRVAGWIAWAGREALSLEIIAASGSWRVSLKPDPVHLLAAAGYNIADIDLENVLAITDARDGAVLSSGLLGGETSDRRATPPPGSRKLTIIVPIYDGYEETRTCLESLFSQRDIVFSTILIDDCAPDPRLSGLVDEAVRRPGVTALRNSRNLGFARSVNRALLISESDDVLLLNADVWLPPTAIARLHDIVTSDEGIGTATPFSNNGQTTSFPRPFVVNAMPSTAQGLAIDGIAEAVNGRQTIDAPSGIGFCLYVSRACLDAVGALPVHYGRGYYEDVEFCLLAVRKGFRNVCATGIFVAHHGATSFGSDKKELVARNLGILETRFPRHALDFLAFAVADPLRSARAAIERRLDPAQDCVLLVAAEPRALWQATRRARELEGSGASAIIVSCLAGGRRVEVRRADSGSPASLDFSLDAAGEAALVAFLNNARAKVVELFDVAHTPDSVIDALLDLDAPLDLFGLDLWTLRGAPAPWTAGCHSLAGPGPCRACVEPSVLSDDTAQRPEREARLARVFTAARSIRSVDRMAAAFAKRVFGAKAEPASEPETEIAPPPTLWRLEPDRIGILAPLPSLESDRVATRLARKLARPGETKRVVVFGSCFAEKSLLATGAAWVAGSAGPEDYPSLAMQYGVGRLAIFSRSGLFGPLDVAARSLGLRKAYFDGSFGALGIEPGDLAIDPRVCDDKAAEMVATWLNSD